MLISAKNVCFLARKPQHHLFPVRSVKELNFDYLKDYKIVFEEKKGFFVKLEC